MPIAKVQCVAQEYWLLDRMNCHCGGTLHAKLHRPSGAPRFVDAVVAECGACGGLHEVEFDSSAFRASPYESVLRHLGIVASSGSDRQWLNYLSATPMDQAVAYIGALSQAGDSLALEYLSDVLAKATAPLAGC